MPHKNKAVAREYNRQYRIAHKVELAAYIHEYAADHREELTAYGQEYRDANKEHISARDRAYYVSHSDELASRRNEQREVLNARAREYSRTHPEIMRARNQIQRTRKAGSTGKFTAQEWQALCEYYNFTCLCCGRNDVRLTIDHVVPLKLGGTNDISNVQCLCQSCNSRKRDKFIDYRPA